MHTNTPVRRPARRAVALTLALAAALVLSACSGANSTTVPSAEASASATQEAGIFTKHVNVCFENKGQGPVTISWRHGVSTDTGSGNLPVGQSVCGEGSAPVAGIAFSGSFTAVVIAQNPALGPPSVSINNSVQVKYNYCTGKICDTRMVYPEYTRADFTQGQTVLSEFEGHHVAITRNSNDDWIQFSVVILD